MNDMQSMILHSKSMDSSIFSFHFNYFNFSKRCFFYKKKLRFAFDASLLECARAIVPVLLDVLKQSSIISVFFIKIINYYLKAPNEVRSSNKALMSFIAAEVIIIFD